MVNKGSLAGVISLKGSLIGFCNIFGLRGESSRQVVKRTVVEEVQLDLVKYDRLLGIGCTLFGISNLGKLVDSLIFIYNN